MKKYTIDGQNVYVTYTGGGSKVITELFCIATTIDNAITICSTLNVFEKQFNNN